MSSAGDRERRLARAAGEGDEAAFAELVAPHRAALVRFVAGRSGRRELAEDAVQEALVSAHRALRDGQRPSDIRAWLHTIAWRRALDLVRRERDVVPLEHAEAATASAGPEPLVLRAAELDHVLATWGDLPARQRQALALSVIEGRSLEHIAASLGLTVGGAKSLVARARRTLVARLEAAELSCDVARAALFEAVDQGVRLRGDVSLHVHACRACARVHRGARLRRRVRAAFVLPLGLFDRFRDLAYVSTAHEPQVSLATKLCATACAATIAGGAGGSALVATGPDGRLGLPTREPMKTELVKERKPPRQRPAPPRKTSAPVPATTAVATTSVSSAPAASSAPSVVSTAPATTGGTAGDASRSVAVVRPEVAPPAPVTAGNATDAAPSAPASTSPAGDATLHVAG